MKAGREIKLLLSELARSNAHTKAVRESNLVFAVSLNDISAISCHRSECEPDALSDFLKSQ